MYQTEHNILSEATLYESKKMVKCLEVIISFSTFAPPKRKIGRVIECAGLEIRYTPFGYRGFESLIFRQQETTDVYRWFPAFMIALLTSLSLKGILSGCERHLLKRRKDVFQPAKGYLLQQRS